MTGNYTIIIMKAVLRLGGYIMLNIMLSFLSTVRVNRETGQLEKKLYSKLLSDGLQETHMTNESAVRYFLNNIVEEGQTLDYYFAITSAKVANTVEKFNNGEAYFEKTSLDYFKQRMQIILENKYGTEVKDVDELVKTIDYDEKAEQDVSLKYVLAIVREIEEVRKNGEEINLYLDVTGGPRDANMLILIISRMLAYDENIHVKNVLYSNINNNDGRVESITNAYNLLDFVAGIAEFINFGSMHSLNRYFGGIGKEQRSSHLNRLLEAMENFAKMTMLCRYGEFKAAITELESAMEKFETEYSKADTKDILEETMYSFFVRIKDKYQLLFTKNKDSVQYIINLIRWTCENNYIQQALTLITERMPECFFDERTPLLTLNPDVNLRKEVEAEFEKFKKEKPEYRMYDINTWLLFRDSNFNTGEATESAEIKEVKDETFMKKASEEVKTAFDMLKKNKRVGEELKTKLHKLAQKCNCLERVNLEECYINISEFQDIYFNNKGVNVSELPNDCENVVYKNLLAEIAKAQNTDEKKTLQNYLKQLTTAELNFYIFAGGEFKAVERRKNIGNYSSIKRKIDKGVLLPAGDKDKVLDLLYTFYQIKEERNTVNHAHDKKENITLDELIEKVESLLEGLEEIINHG